MWIYTECVNGEVKKVIPLQYVSSEKLIALWKTMGFEEDALGTYPEWNRYSFLKWKEGEGLINLNLEWEETV